MIFCVPTTKAKEFLAKNEYITATDEGEAVALACGYYLATGKKATVILGENGLLNALDAIITLVQLHNIPIDLRVYVRADEPQHEMVARGVKKLIKLYKIKCKLY